MDQLNVRETERYRAVVDAGGIASQLLSCLHHFAQVSTSTAEESPNPEPVKMYQMGLVVFTIALAPAKALW